MGLLNPRAGSPFILTAGAITLWGPGSSRLLRGAGTMLQEILILGKPGGTRKPGDRRHVHCLSPLKKGDYVPSVPILPVPSFSITAGICAGTFCRIELTVS